MILSLQFLIYGYTGLQGNEILRFFTKAPFFNILDLCIVLLPPCCAQNLFLGNQNLFLSKHTVFFIIIYYYYLLKASGKGCPQGLVWEMEASSDGLLL